ncbi:prepilin-type N-terminal cleavage/methylation domain-containing protein [bacterium]|nr:prepilin-type N-terminal cleavage/methylation domain-containing protein [bacterium]
MNRTNPAGGFSLLEVLISAFILSILSVSVVHSLTALEVESRLAQSRMAAVLLASDLREEILSKPPVDPNEPPVLGRESSEFRRESASARIDYDDQDDYQDLVDRPATDIGGTPLSGMDRIWRRVRIESVSKTDPSGPSIDTQPLGLRRFTVTVYKDEIELTRLVWLGYGQ